MQAGEVTQHATCLLLPAQPPWETGKNIWQQICLAFTQAEVSKILWWIPRTHLLPPRRAQEKCWGCSCWHLLASTLGQKSDVGQVTWACTSVLWVCQCETTNHWTQLLIVQNKPPLPSKWYLTGFAAPISCISTRFNPEERRQHCLGTTSSSSLIQLFLITHQLNTSSFPGSSFPYQTDNVLDSSASSVLHLGYPLETLPS